MSCRASIGVVLLGLVGCGYESMPPDLGYLPGTIDASDTSPTDANLDATQDTGSSCTLSERSCQTSRPDITCCEQKALAYDPVRRCLFDPGRDTIACVPTPSTDPSCPKDTALDCRVTADGTTWSLTGRPSGWETSFASHGLTACSESLAAEVAAAQRCP